MKPLFGLVASVGLVTLGLLALAPTASASTCAVGTTACVSTYPCLAGFEVSRGGPLYGAACNFGNWYCTAEAGSTHVACVWLLTYPYWGGQCVAGISVIDGIVVPVGCN
jgi:hypothetical protein